MSVNHLHRVNLVHTLHKKFEPKFYKNWTPRFVHIGAAPGTGKTSLLQLYRKSRELLGETCVYLGMGLGQSANTLLLRGTGIDVNNSTVDATGVCGDPKRLCTVLLDDAQNYYNTRADQGFWEDLIKGDNSAHGWLPPNIRFVICATYSLSTDCSPVVFSDLPKLTTSDMLLSGADEVSMFLDQAAARMDSEMIGHLLRDNATLRRAITAYCGTHVGLLNQSVRALGETYFHENPTVKDVVTHYLSVDFLASFKRCFSTEMESFPIEVRALLLHLLFNKEKSTGPPEFVGDALVAYDRLLQTGILTQRGTTDPSVAFTSRAAERYISNLIFPNRALKAPRDPFSLMKAVI